MLRSDPTHPRTKCCRPPCCYVSPEAPTLSRPTKADEGDVSSGAAFPPRFPRRAGPMRRADLAVRRFWSSAADQALVRQQLSTKSPMLAACVSVRPTSSQGELHHNQNRYHTVYSRREPPLGSITASLARALGHNVQAKHCRSSVP